MQIFFILFLIVDIFFLNVLLIFKLINIDLFLRID